ncbi:hypothetical protein ACIQWA_07550 [Kitasatospora sp. NPDC098652]|uniref:hypothetical protein n=1 Tax=Kitasatospora sp. NPDC098652 TaxID=3364095 RepID=UPI0037F44737
MNLNSYSTALAAKLPGTWRVEHHQNPDPDRADLISLLVLRPTPQFADFQNAAVLHNLARPIGLLVTEEQHPTRPGYTIRSIALTEGNSYMEHVNEGEALELHVPGDREPASAAADIARDLLPRHDQIRARQRLTVLERALGQAQAAVDHWDSISDSLSDEQGWPLDEKLYGDGVVRRDAAALRHLQDVLPYAEALLRDGRTAQANLSPGPTADRAGWMLGELENAFTSARGILHQWNDTLTRTTTVDGYNEAIEERNAETWHDAYTWLSHGPALTALLRSAAEPGGAIRSAAAQARSPRRVAGGPPGQAEPSPGPTSVKQAPEQRR